MSSQPADVSPIKTTHTVFSVIEALQELEDALIIELADYLELAPSTVHAHLTSLEREGYVVKDDDQYRLSLKFLSIGQDASEKYTIASIARPILYDISEETGQVAWLSVEERGKGICIEFVEMEGIRVSGGQGARFELHTTASGKAMLAYVPEDRKQTIFERSGLEYKTENTITDRQVLEDELETIRTDGYATSDGETREGLRSIAVPILYSGTLYGTVSVSGPRHRLTETEQIVRVLKEAQNEIQIRIARQRDQLDRHPRIFD